MTNQPDFSGSERGETRISDQRNRVQKFGPDGTFLTSFGQKGNGPGQFFYITAVAVAEDGTVFAADFANNRIEKWRPMR